MSTDVTELVALLDLADLDAQMARLDARAATLAGRRAESESMGAVRLAADRNRAAAEADDAARRTQIRLEGQVSELEERIRRADTRLRQLSDTHQIEAAQREVATLRQQQSALEDELLTAMEGAEAAERELHEAGQAEREAQEQSDVTNEQLVGELRDAEQSRAEVSERRAAVVEQIAPELLDQYEGLRRRGVRPAAARFEGGRCQGCHLTLPATEVDQLRSLPPDALIFCSECGCLLVRTPRPPASEAEPES